MFNKEYINWEAKILLKKDSSINNKLAKSKIVGEIDQDTFIEKGVKVTFMQGNFFVHPIGGFHSVMSRVALTLGGVAYEAETGSQRVVFNIDLYLSGLSFFLGTPDYQRENEMHQRVSIDFDSLLGKKYSWNQLEDCKKQNTEWAIKAVNSIHNERSAESKHDFPSIGSDEMSAYDSVLLEGKYFNVVFRRIWNKG